MTITGFFTNVITDHTINATFTQDEYTLTVNTVGNGSVTRVPSQTIYRYGDVVTLTATPDASWYFGQWTGDASGALTQTILTMNADKVVTATFIETPPTYYPLTLSVVGNGTTTPAAGTHSYLAGTNVNLSASPASGWQFDGWSGDVDSTSNPAQVTLDADKTVTATFSQRTYTLTPTAGVGGRISPDTVQTVDHGDTLTFTITPDTGYHITDVLVDGTSRGISESYTFANITADHTIHAVFGQDEYALTVNATGSGTVTCVPSQTTYRYGDVVTLTATPDASWYFGQWTGDASGALTQTTLTMNADKVVTATFIETPPTYYPLTLRVVGNGTTTPAAGTHSYLAGTNVNLSASPASGWQFDGWSGDVDSTSNPAQVTLDADKIITATFSQTPSPTYTLDVRTEGSGSVAVDPDQTSYISGTQVTLMAEPAAGWAFTGWSGDVDSTSNPAQVTLDADKIITATFSQTPSPTYTLDVRTEGSGSVVVDPDQTSYISGTQVTLMAEPAAGWTFTGWSGDVDSTSNPAQVTLDADKVITVTFSQTPPPTYTLDVRVQGSGSVAVDPDQTSYLAGTVVELSARPDDGWHFAGWTGDLESSVNPAQVTLDADKVVTATFARVPPCIPITRVTLTRAPDGALYAGDLLRFTAQPNGDAPYTYTWTLNGQPVGGNRSAWITDTLAAGTYTAAVTVSNACGQAEASHPFTIEAAPAQPRPDLSASYKQVSPRYAEAGEQITYTLVLRNRSDISATAALTDAVPFRNGLPADVTYVAGSATASAGVVTDTGGYVLWRGDIVSGTPVVLSFSVVVTDDLAIGAVITNTASLDDGVGRIYTLTAVAQHHPGYRLTINDGALYTNIPTVTLAYLYDDAAITQVKFSNDGGFGERTGWLPVAADLTHPGWTLATYGDLVLPRTVYALFRDAAGRQYGPFQDDIVYDSAAPTITRFEILTTTTRRQPTAIAQAVTLRVTSSDNNSGVAWVQVSHSRDFSDYETFESTGRVTDIPWALQDSGAVYVRAGDRAGNISAAVSNGPMHQVYLPLVQRE